MDYLVLVPAGYLLGSLPFGLIAGWMLRGVDLREHGSGNTGMTNVLRIVGPHAAVPVLLLDVGKSALAVVVARMASGSAGVEAAAALAALVGHMWPVYVGFRGGRGAASGWGGLLALSPVSGLIATVVGVTAIGVSRYVSVASLIAATVGAVALVVLSLTGAEPLAHAWYGVVGAPLIVARHRDNIQRLLRGEERRLGRPGGGAVAVRGKAVRKRGLRWPGSA